MQAAYSDPRGSVSVRMGFDGSNEVPLHQPLLFSSVHPSFTVIQRLNDSVLIEEYQNVYNGVYVLERS